MLDAIFIFCIQELLIELSERLFFLCRGTWPVIGMSELFIARNNETQRGGSLKREALPACPAPYLSPTLLVSFHHKGNKPVCF